MTRVGAVSSRAGIGSSLAVRLPVFRARPPPRPGTAGRRSSPLLPSGAVNETDVVIVAYNSADTLRACVEPLARHPSLSLVVVDNASSDDGARTIADLDVTIIESSRNLGFAGGCNLGWRRGTSPFVVFVNPDVRTDPEDLLRLTDALGSPDVGLVAPRILNDDGSIQHSQHRFPTLISSWLQAAFLHRALGGRPWAHEDVVAAAAYARPGEPDWVGGACIALRRDTLEALDGFDELFFMYCEDMDLCRRVRDRGLRVEYTPSATVSHTGGVSAPRPQRVEMLTRSRVLYAAKFGSSLEYWLFVAALALGLVVRVILDSGHRAAHVGGLRGLTSGIAQVRRTPVRRRPGP